MPAIRLLVSVLPTFVAIAIEFWLRGSFPVLVDAFMGLARVATFSAAFVRIVMPLSFSAVVLALGFC